MTQTHPSSTGALWARFRFSVVGSLLSSPPARGALKTAIRCLAAKTWSHPVTGRDVQFLGRHHRAVVLHSTAPARRPRRRLAPRRAQRLRQGVPGRGACRAALSPVPRPPALELPTALRQPRRSGEGRSFARAAPLLFHSPALHAGSRLGAQAEASARRDAPAKLVRKMRRQTREIRSYEAEYVGSLWHLDFHHGSLKVLTPGGQWLRPIALGILDDHSRLCCHVQWYLSETAEDLVHGLSQAIQKRGLPRALLTDNGSAMVAEEVTEGLLRLGIVHERTLPYSPYQNGKQEAFWGTLEGRLMKMLDGVAELTLEFLNQATQAWMEIEYNRAVHRETSSSPVERFAQAPDVLRSSPSSESLRDAFRLETTEDSASERWNDLARGRALRDSRQVSSLPRSDRALRPLGPRPGRSGRRAQRNHSGSHLSSRQDAPTPTAAAPLSSPTAPTCRPTTAGAKTASCRRF